jgi:hypothetical protein
VKATSEAVTGSSGIAAGTEVKPTGSGVTFTVGASASGKGEKLGPGALTEVGGGTLGTWSGTAVGTRVPQAPQNLGALLRGEPQLLQKLAILLSSRACPEWSAFA